MKKRVTCSVGNSTAPVSLASFTIIITLSTKCSLIYLALFCTTKWHSIIFKLYKINMKRPIFSYSIRCNKFLQTMLLLRNLILKFKYKLPPMDHQKYFLTYKTAAITTGLSLFSRRFVASQTVGNKGKWCSLHPQRSMHDPNTR